MGKELSIIIVNWNTKDLLRGCLKSIFACNNTGSVDVTVVDNASKDGSAKMVTDEFPEVRLINSGGNIGFARANNLAIGETDSPYILFLNPDTETRDGSVQAMVEVLKSHPSVAAVGCKMRNGDGSVQPVGLQWDPSPLTEILTMLFLSARTIAVLRSVLPYFDPEESGYLRKLYGGCLMVRKDVLQEVGHFDERFFMYAEDVDLCRRIRKAGWKLYYLAEAEIFHLGAGASRNTVSTFATLTKCDSLCKFMEKYHGQVGKYLYKGAVFLSSNIRLGVLLVLEIIQTVMTMKYAGKYKGPIGKYSAMLRWSLNIEMPVVPG